MDQDQVGCAMTDSPHGQVLSHQTTWEGGHSQGRVRRLPLNYELSRWEGSVARTSERKSFLLCLCYFGLHGAAPSVMAGRTVVVSLVLCLEVLDGQVPIQTRT